MKTYRIPQTDLTVSRLAYGPANLSGWDHGPLTSEVIAKTAGVIQTAFDQGINFLDLADMEGFGKVEQVVGEVLKQSSGLRAKLVLQTKCGMRFREGAGFD